MTSLQQEFYKLIRQKVIEFNEDFHEEMTIQRLEKIPDEQLKYLLDDIYSDKDAIAPKKHKGYITYAKFIYYTDKKLEQQSHLLLDQKLPQVDELYEKREMLIQLLLNSTNSINERNQLIENIQTKKSIFEIDGKNILDQCDYYIIEQFGFYNFFDPNKNYMIKEELEKHLLNYTLLGKTASNQKLFK